MFQKFGQLFRFKVAAVRLVFRRGRSLNDLQQLLRCWPHFINAGRIGVPEVTLAGRRMDRAGGDKLPPDLFEFDSRQIVERFDAGKVGGLAEVNVPTAAAGHDLRLVVEVQIGKHVAQLGERLVTPMTRVDIERERFRVEPDA